MSSYVLERIQKLPITLDEAWTFFSVPGNLSEMTPSDMNFKVIHDSGGMPIFAGQIITYNVSPLLGIPLFWMTEITHVTDKKYFVDEQRFGPYALWHHAHFFTEIEGGVEIRDVVNYKLPFGYLGVFAHWFFVKKQLNNIFDYRREMLLKKFGKGR